MPPNLKHSDLGVIYGNRDFFSDHLVTESPADIATVFAKFGGVETHNRSQRVHVSNKKRT